MKKEFTQWCSLVRENQQIKATRTTPCPSFFVVANLAILGKMEVYSSLSLSRYKAGKESVKKRDEQ